MNYFFLFFEQLFPPMDLQHNFEYSANMNNFLEMFFYQPGMN